MALVSFLRSVSAACSGGRWQTHARARLVFGSHLVGLCNPAQHLAWFGSLIPVDTFDVPAHTPAVAAAAYTPAVAAAAHTPAIAAAARTPAVATAAYTPAIAATAHPSADAVALAAPAFALAAAALALAATNTPITALAAQMCGRLQPRHGH
jgi:hypothetical protein